LVRIVIDMAIVSRAAGTIAPRCAVRDASRPAGAFDDSGAVISAAAYRNGAATSQTPTALRQKSAAHGLHRVRTV
jgi:hypothetical protein